MATVLDGTPIGLCNIPPSPGDFPRGRPAHLASPRPGRRVRRLRTVASPDPEPLICSAKGCRAAAVYQLRWNNPKLHAPEARKVWLACEEHRHWLSDFLAARGFLRSVDRLPSAGADADTA
jgi:hypothetical protein